MHKNSIVAGHGDGGYDVEVVMGGPVTPLFQAKTEIAHKFIDFSQRRLKGYRKAYEFDMKRVLVADER